MPQVRGLTPKDLHIVHQKFSIECQTWLTVDIKDMLPNDDGSFLSDSGTRGFKNVYDAFLWLGKQAIIKAR